MDYGIGALEVIAVLIPVAIEQVDFGDAWNRVAVRVG
jgi:hypothetical protein